MAYGGRGGGGFSLHFKAEPFVLFPEIELPDVKGVADEKDLINCKTKLQRYFRSSPYYLEENAKKKRESSDIERFSDILQLPSQNFPKELIGDPRRVNRRAKKIRWNLDPGLEKLDMFEKFEKDLVEDQEKEKREEENTDNDQGEESDQSYSDDGDYNESQHFDDDDVEENNDDEAVY